MARFSMLDAHRAGLHSGRLCDPLGRTSCGEGLVVGIVGRSRTATTDRQRTQRILHLRQAGSPRPVGGTGLALLCRISSYRRIATQRGLIGTLDGNQTQHVLHRDSQLHDDRRDSWRNHACGITADLLVRFHAPRAFSSCRCSCCHRDEREARGGSRESPLRYREPPWPARA